jgi:hypothetical protein
MRSIPRLVTVGTAKRSWADFWPSWPRREAEMNRNRTVEHIKVAAFFFIIEEKRLEFGFMAFPCLS